MAPHRVHKLSDAPGALAVTAEVAEPAFDDAALSCAVVISTQNEDRSGDTVVTDGIRTDNHQKNPVVLYEHGFGGLRVPVGLAEKDGVYTVKKEPGRVLATTFFNPKLADAEQVYRLVRERYLRGASIGFKPVRCEHLTEPGDAENPWPRFLGVRWDEVELLEYSHVAIPDNPECLALAEEALGKSWLTSEAVRKSLLSRLPQKKSTTVTVPEQPPMPAATEEKKDAPPPEKKDAPPVKKSAEGGEGYVPLEDDPKDRGDAREEEVPDDGVADNDLPPGARSLQSLYNRYLEHADFVAGEHKRMENPGVKEFYDSEAGELEAKCVQVASLYAREYPDLAPLDKGVDEADEGGDTEDDAGDEEAKAVRVWAKRLAPGSRLHKRVLALRKARKDAAAKRLSKTAAGMCRKAAGFLDEMSTLKGEDFGETHKAASAHHAAQLKSIADNPDDDSEDMKVLRESVVKLNEKCTALAQRLKRAVAGR